MVLWWDMRLMAPRKGCLQGLALRRHKYVCQPMKFEVQESGHVVSHTMTPKTGSKALTMMS